MSRYKVKAGSHYQDGAAYGEGDVVETDIALTALFPEKFVKLAPSSVTATAEEEEAAEGTGRKRRR